MAKRSPMNKRYQKDTQVGSTRKSAAAAKPKRSAGDGSSGSTKKSSSAKRTSASSRGRVELPPELKRLQKISFGMLGGAVVLSLLYLWKGPQLGIAGSVVLGVAYALMFSALYIDFAKIRPYMKAMQQRGSGPKSTKPDKSQTQDKPAKAAKAATAEKPAKEESAADLDDGADGSAD
jgi:hypothetical protein